MATDPHAGKLRPAHVVVNVDNAAITSPATWDREPFPAIDHARHAAELIDRCDTVLVVLEGFSDEARRAVALAQREAPALGYSFLNTDHILLGLLCVGDDEIDACLDAWSVTAERVRWDLAVGIEPAVSGPETLPVTPRVRMAVRLASIAAADRRGRRLVSPTDLLLALIVDGGTATGNLLSGFGATPDALRDALLTGSTA